MKRGDHILVSSTVLGIPFQHHGIFMGDDTVIHLAPASGARVTVRDDSDEFSVRRDSLAEFCRGAEPDVVRHDDQLPGDEVAGNAESYLGKTGYSLFENNCEHFATRCATGRSESHQIEMGEATVSAMASMATKAFWTVSSKVGSKVAMKSAVRVHPATMLADGVEIATLAIGCRSGLTARRSRRLAKFSGAVAAAGVGGLVGGPAGAAICVAAHTSSGAVADQLCKSVRQLLS